MNQKQTVSLETVLKGIKPIDKEAVKAAKSTLGPGGKAIKQFRRVRRRYLPHCRCKKAGRIFPG